MQVIGLAGGVASGKSTVARFFSDLGADSLDADRIGHDVLRELEIKRQIRKEFGPLVFDSAGEIIRSQLAGLVFGRDAQHRAQLQRLEAITHPRIGERLDQELNRLRDAGSMACVLDAAVMFKAGWDRKCSRIVFVDAPRDVRWNRARRRGWTEEQFADREANQMELEKKQTMATDFVDNSTDDPALLRAQVESLWRGWGLPIQANRQFPRPNTDTD